MQEDTIEAISSKGQSKKISSFDRWQQYLDHLEAEIANSDSDPFESALVQKMMTMAHHVNASEAKRTSQQLRDFIKDVQIKDLTNSHKPGFKEIAPVTIQLISGVAAAALGVVPVVGGFAQGSINICSSISTGITAVGVNGAQSVGGVFSGKKQGDLAAHNHDLQISNQQHDDIIQSRREAEESRKRQAEEAKQLEAQKHQTKQSIMA